MHRFRRIPAALRELQLLWTWSLDELHRWSVQRREAAVAGRPAYLMARQVNGSFSLSEIDADEPRLVECSFPRDGGDVGDSPILPEEWRARSVAVLLDSYNVLIHEVRFPVAAEPELAAAVELWLEGEMPVPRNQLVCDWSIVCRESAPSSLIVVQLIVARSSEVTKILHYFEGLGLSLVRIGATVPARGLAEGTMAGNLLAGVRQSGARKGLWREFRLLHASLAAVCMLFAVLGVQCVERFVLADDLAGADEEIFQYTILATRARRALAPAVELTKLMNAPDAADALISLTSQFPADAWLSELHIELAQDIGYEIKATGLAPRAGGLVRQLEKMEGLRDVKLISGRSEGLGIDRDRVEFAARWHVSYAR